MKPHFRTECVRVRIAFYAHDCHTDSVGEIVFQYAILETE